MRTNVIKRASCRGTPFVPTLSRFVVLEYVTSSSKFILFRTEGVHNYTNAHATRSWSVGRHSGRGSIDGHLSKLHGRCPLGEPTTNLPRGTGRRPTTTGVVFWSLCLCNIAYNLHLHTPGRWPLPVQVQQRRTTSLLLLPHPPGWIAHSWVQTWSSYIVISDVKLTLA